MFETTSINATATATNILPIASITGTLMPLAGGALLGFCAGWAIKKIVKLAFIGLGLLALFLGFLEYKHWISVNWGVVENQTQVLMTHAANKIAAVTSQMGHQIPIGMGHLGFTPGLVLGLMRG